MNRKKIWIVVAITGVVLGIVLGIGFYRRGAGRGKKVTILTATKGGTYWPLGQCLAQILKKLPPVEDANAIETDGSIDNIERLLDKKDNVVAFTIASDLRNTEAKDQLRILARLYDDVMHIVVRKGASINSLDDLKEPRDVKRRVYIGLKNSGTRRIAMRIIHAAIDPNDFKTRKDITDEELEKTLGIYCKLVDKAPIDESISLNDDADEPISFNDAAGMLRKDELDVAFFLTGTLTEAVRDALDPNSSLRVEGDESDSNECSLLGLDETVVSQLTSGLGLGVKRYTILERLYSDYQPTITTLASEVLLICRKDLDEGLAATIVKGLFYDTESLKIAHSKALEIKLKDALDKEDPPVYRWHSGVNKFLDETLLIATGAMNGYYYRLGRSIQKQLETWGIPAVTIHTNGSFENAKLLKDRHAIAVMQYDAALAAKCGNLKSVYKVDIENMDISQVKGICRIATLHEEKVHVIMREDALNKIERDLEDPNSQTGTIKRLDKLCDALQRSDDKIEVCVGPENSGTQAIARAVIKFHDLEDYIEGYPNPLQLPVSDMVERLHADTLDAGFFVSHVPTGALLTIVQDAEAFRLLSLGSRERRQMESESGVFKMSRIELGTYDCQDEAIDTIATRAVLVTTLDLPERFPVRDITEAIFEGEAYLGIGSLNKIAMAGDLASLSPHPDAMKYYKTKELLGPNPPAMHWLKQTWTILGILTMLITVMLIPGCSGLIVLRRNRTANAIGRRILAIPTEASFRKSVERLLEIRDEIQERVRRRWWLRGELDKRRWRYLRDLIHDRIGEAKENLTRAFVTEIRAVMSDTELSDAGRQKRCRSIENRILEFFEKAELDPSQQKILRELLRECGQQNAKTKESKDVNNEVSDCSTVRELEQGNHDE